MDRSPHSAVEQEDVIESAKALLKAIKSLPKYLKTSSSAKAKHPFETVFAEVNQNLHQAGNPQEFFGGLASVVDNFSKTAFGSRQRLLKEYVKEVFQAAIDFIRTSFQFINHKIYSVNLDFGRALEPAFKKVLDLASNLFEHFAPKAKANAKKSSKPQQTTTTTRRTPRARL